MDDLIAEFLTETAESLEVVDSELVRFEANPNERKTLDNIFRLVHTVKGTCGFLGLGRLEAVAHAGETLLGRFRDGKLEVTPTAVTLVLHSIDRIKLILAGIENTGIEPEGDDQDLISQLEAMSEGRDVELGNLQTVVIPNRPIMAEPDFSDTIAIVEKEPDRAVRVGEVSLDELEAAFLAAEAPDWMNETDDEQATPEPQAEAKIEASAATTKTAAKPIDTKSVDFIADDSNAISTQQSIRVSLDVLEGLMTLVSEMVLTRNQLMQISRNRDDSAFATPLQRLSTLTGELQDSVMKTRMQPIGAAWKKLPRLVRDMSIELDKKIDLVMEGEATELDRQILELIRDPLTHMVRNSADHGLESTQERIDLGKSAHGVVKLSAYHEGGYIVIKLSDNGRGLNTQRIREKILERGMASRTELDTMSDQQAQRYIFAPGFSTAAAVTNLSGRGVGMDVVRTNIEQIGGQIDLLSIAGQGTTFTIKIPLTLAIVSALIVGAGKQKFAVPQTSVMELVRTGGMSEHKIERIEQTLVLRLRDKLLPLVQLGSALQLEAAKDETPNFVMVIQVGERRYGLIVNEVLDTEEIVVKPLAGILRSVDTFSGATILGDGSVVLILDPNAMSERAGIVLEDKAAETHEDTGVNAKANRVAMLLFKAGDGVSKAVELEHITRLEHIEIDKIEQMQGRTALQYRGKLMPIINIGNYFDTTNPEAVQPLLVFTHNGYAMGLAVDEIVDVVEDYLKIELSPDRCGVRGTAIIDGRACEILDVDYYRMQGLAEHSKADHLSEDGSLNTYEEREVA